MVVMGREWAPGDVALLEIGCHANRHVGTFVGGGWRYGHDKWVANDPAIVTAHPLVVINADDREQAKRLTDEYEAHRPSSTDLTAHMQAALRSLIEPPKPRQPSGLGAVVVDDEGTQWMRMCAGIRLSRPWARVGRVGSSSGWSRWDAFTAVKVLSEGVS